MTKALILELFDSPDYGKKYEFNTKGQHFTKSCRCDKLIVHLLVQYIKTAEGYFLAMLDVSVDIKNVIGLTKWGKLIISKYNVIKNSYYILSFITLCLRI